MIKQNARRLVVAFGHVLFVDWVRPALAGEITKTRSRDMSHPIVHAEIRSSDPDATREFCANLFGWSYSDGAYPGYTFVAAGAEGGPPTAISPLQADADQVLFFVGVADVAATLDQAEKLGGTIVQPAQQVPGVTFGVFADPQGHQIGVAAQG